jgi:hypothetical protein
MYIIGLIIISLIDDDNDSLGLRGTFLFLIYTIVYILIFAVCDINWIDFLNKSLFYTNPKWHIYP